MAIEDEPASRAPHWPLAHRALHWGVAATIAVAAPLGLAIVELSDAEVRALTAGGMGMGEVYWWHKSFGFLVLGLMALRIASRLRIKEPPHDPPLSGVQRLASGAVHRTLYVLLLATPMLGWIGTSAYGPDAATFFGLTMPDLVAPDRALSSRVLDWHGTVALVVLGTIAVHLGAAAYHGWIKRDKVVQRMTGGGG
jgi:cytochrome b561